MFLFVCIVFLNLAFWLGYIFGRTKVALRSADRLVAYEKINNPSFHVPTNAEQWDEANTYFRNKYGF